jgi:hypothetical protein
MYADAYRENACTAVRQWHHHMGCLPPWHSSRGRRQRLSTRSKVSAQPVCHRRLLLGDKHLAVWPGHQSQQLPAVRAGSIAIAGAGVSWLRDKLQVMQTAMQMPPLHEAAALAGRRWLWSPV